ncbi:FAD-dependent monooxygenase [Tropicimonas sp. IMCC34011]|uniref:FAD-dependent monooxygenase n=1 Tax=Tropicimonas sp. IMCC34011 TaxID=2248759 RepID=UPI000E2766FA|nr:FAD-dependent monooxygenase [Tropicimonas sp. IMCC34011]
MLSGRDIIVLGAGIGGLAAAAALARRGARVRVLERADALSEVGAGIQVGPNGMRVLHGLGCGAAARDASVAAGRVTLRDSRKGRRIVSLDLTRFGEFRQFHRADLLSVLERAARGAGVSIETGREATNVRALAEGAEIDFVDGERIRTSLLVAADGIHSKGREAVVGEMPAVFSGQIAWRATVPGDQLEMPSGAEVFLGAGKHLVAYALRGGKELNLVGVEARDERRPDGWDHSAAPEAMRAAFAGFGGPVPGWLAAVETARPWGLWLREPMKSWSSGGVVLLGDAAHPMLPFLAQGATMALEDAAVLATLIERPSPDATALAAFSALRIGRVRKVTAAAAANARNYHLGGGLARIAHASLSAMERISPNTLPNRFAWLYEYDPWTAAGR